MVPNLLCFSVASLGLLLQPDCLFCLFSFSMGGSQLPVLPDRAPPQWLKEEAFVTELCPWDWLTASQWGTREGVRWGRWVLAGRGGVYLRKYQASRAMMSSSRDRTSTVGRMWWLEDVTSSEEEGEAEPEVKEHRRQRSRKWGSRPTTYMHMLQNVWLHSCLWNVNINRLKQNQDLTTQHTSCTYAAFCLQGEASNHFTLLCKSSRKPETLRPKTKVTVS